MSGFNPDLAHLSPEQKRALLEKLLREKKTTLPVSYGQRGLWLLHQRAPNSFAYNINNARLIRSLVDVAALKRAIQKIVDRHSQLRAVFKAQDEGLVQDVYQYREASFEQIDASAWDERERYRQVVAYSHRPFDLQKGPLARWALFTRAADDHVLLFNVHHIVFDGWSMGIVLEELRQLYEAETTGKPASLPPIGVPYSSFVQWQADLMQSAEGERLGAYWRQKLSGTLPGLNLHTDFPRPAVQTFNGASYDFLLDGEVTHRLRVLAQTEGVTLYMLLMAAFQVLLQRYSGQDDILVASPMSLRSRTEYAQTIGYFVNQVVMRALFTPETTFRDLVKQARQNLLEALDHQDFPFIALVEQGIASADTSRPPVAQAMFNLLKIQEGDTVTVQMGGQLQKRADYGGLEVEVYPTPNQEGHTELSLEFLEIGETLVGSLKYNVDLFEAQTIARMHDHFGVLLDGIIGHPESRVSDLPLLTTAERNQILVKWNETSTPFPNLTVNQMFEAQAAHTPDAVAVIHEGEALTYAELNSMANQLARYLHQLGAAPDRCVGVYVERSLDLVISLLAVLKAGAAYIPMDPVYPRQRLGFMIEDAQPPLIITQHQLLNQLPEHQAMLVVLDRDAEAISAQATDNLPASAGADHLAYVIFTSGSTGRPKGVAIEHRSLTNFLDAFLKEPGSSPNDVWLSVTTFSFDIFGLDLYLPLISGARLVLASSSVVTHGMALVELMNQADITTLQATPATWSLLFEAGWKGKPGMRLLCGGEALPLPLMQQLLATGGRLWNLYGPTEATIWATLCEITTPEVTIGRPFQNVEIYILDAAHQPVPISVPGTLYIGGVCVARGYLNRIDLTDERFIKNPFGKPGRIYNTGDLARYLPDGRIQHLGRMDNQIKIRGFRIELDEIEASLLLYPGIIMAAATVRDERLYAYYTMKSGKINAQDLKSFLRERLPDYMIPSGFFQLEAMPLTPNGKIDRKVLPVVKITTSEYTLEPAQSDMEKIILQIWQELLEVDPISIYDNFFDLGGHSMMAMQMIIRMSEKTGIQVDPAYIRFQTLGQLAAHYEEAIAAAGDLPPLPETESQPENNLPGKLFRTLRRVVSTK
jgi:amino acid adenylation domain-containing protein